MTGQRIKSFDSKEFMPDQIAERNESNQYVRPKTGYDANLKQRCRTL